ncbi:SDR family oxidoreductase [Mangrovicella endophytica]|uniref:SDR family oxidoreductase n=1 Tax=Mangrovicella endophytica TaxID=2066697 RepID=UPI000C9EBF56|nr:SDR family oxidoreductase [Mangrovicella endophytica]
MRLFVFGHGYSAGRYVETLGDGTMVTGVTCRSAERAASLRAGGLPALRFDGSPGDDDAAIEAALRETTHLLVSIGPNADGDPVLNRWRETLLQATPALAWIGYLSTVGVYGDHGGAWVDEQTPPRPVSRRSVERVAAEAAWQELADARGVPLATLRLSGIYGPGRNAVVNLREGTARRLVKPGQVFNRIHVDDIAGALRLLAGGRTGGVFNVTDDEPAPPQDVVAYAADLIGVAPPPEIDFASAELTPMARSFYGENKRVRNMKLKSLCYEFIFPTFREGIAAVKSDEPRKKAPSQS